MSTMQKIIIWVLILIGVFIFSDFLINVGINATYKDITRKNENPQIVVYQAEATYVNGRIRGLIKNPKEIQEKYLKVEMYSKRNVSLGVGYIEIEHAQEEQAFEILFKATDVATYKIETVNEKDKIENKLEILPKEWTKPEVLLTTAMMLLIFW